MCCGFCFLQISMLFYTTSASSAAEVATLLARLSSFFQHQAEPRMLHIMNQASHIMMLVEGTSLAVNQWDRKLREANWTLCSSDDHHHWLGVRTVHSDTAVRKLVDKCSSEHQKIWYNGLRSQPWHYLHGQAGVEGWPKRLSLNGCAC